MSYLLRSSSLVTTTRDDGDILGSLPRKMNCETAIESLEASSNGIRPICPRLKPRIDSWIGNYTVLLFPVGDNDLAYMFIALYVTEGLYGLFEWEHCGYVQGVDVTLTNGACFLEANFPRDFIHDAFPRQVYSRV